MNSTVSDAIAAGIAALPRVVATPVGDLGFGSDISCANDLRESMPDVSDSRQVLSEAIARRLDCLRGSNPDDPNYGVDLREALHKPTTIAELRDRQTSAESELRKDDRIDAVSVAIVPSATLDALDVSIVVVPRDTVIGGPFSLTLTLTDAGILIKEIGA
jgi:hypothetical protein